MSDAEKCSPMSRVTLLMPWARQDSWKLFRLHAQDAYNFWATLVLDSKRTTFKQVHLQVRTIDSIIYDKRQVYWKRRLAQIQLARILANLEVLVKREKQKRRTRGRSREKGNAAIVRKIYLRALGGRKSPRDVITRIRWCKRMARLIDGSMFLAVAYSNLAETKT